MSAEKIIASWKKKQYKPINWFEGEEAYYIDMLTDYAEHHILDESEAGFNLTVFYGKDANWADVINACRRYPMFAERQVVILKEAQQMKDLEKLEGYIEAPLTSTIFVVAHKEKTLDKRKKLYKTVSKGEYINSEKIKEWNLNKWITEYLQTTKYTMKPKAIALIEEHLGNDLSRIVNEIEKVAINLKNRTEITEDDIEQYIGISKEYNVFELQDAIAKKNMSKALKIIKYFEGNPKAAPIQMVLPALYGSFSRIYAAFGLADKSEAGLKPHFFFNPSAVKNALETMNSYKYEGIERILLLLHHYNLKGIGIGDSGATSDASLIKEMVVKMILG